MRDQHFNAPVLHTRINSRKTPIYFHPISLGSLMVSEKYALVAFKSIRP